jgi:membrane protease YdiL (CAAX protease family)
MTETGAAREVLAAEAPYIGAVLFVFALAVGQAVAPAPDRPRRPAVDETKLGDPEATGRRIGAFATPLLLAGLAVWGWAISRKARGRVLLPARPASPARWNLWDAIKLPAVQQTLAALMLAACVGWLGTEAAQPGTWPFYAVHAAASLFAVAVGVKVVVADRGGDPDSVGLTSQGMGRALAAGGLGFLAFWPVHLGLVAGMAWLQEKTGISLPPQREVARFLTEDDPTLLAVLAAHAVVVAPLVEEFYFRALLIPLCSRHMRLPFAVALSAGLFTLAHVNATAAVPIFLLGVMLGWLYARTRSLAAPVALHVCYNASSLVMMFLARGG